MDYQGSMPLELLKNSLENVDWFNSNERHDIFWQFYEFFVDWIGPCLNLRDIFGLEDVERILCNAINFCDDPPGMVLNYGLRFMQLVTNKIGYKDEPELGIDGKPSEQRITPIHCAARHSTRCGPIIYELFKIYDSWDANYSDERGLTHLHVACAHGMVEIVEKLLDAGHDSNCIVWETGDSPLHFALNRGHAEVAKLLLRRGANPNIINNEGSSPLHVIRWDHQYSETLLSRFFDVIDDQELEVKVDVRDNNGKTPLHKISSQIFWLNARAVKLLVSRGADLGAACTSGSKIINNKRKRNDDRPVRTVKAPKRLQIEW